MTYSYDFIYDKIKKFKPDNKESTIITYSKNAFNLQKKNIKIDDQISIINFFGENKNKFTTYYKKSSLVSLSIFLQSINASYKKVSNMIWKLSLKLDDEKDEKDEKDKQKMVKREDLINIYNLKLEEVNTYNINNKDKKILNRKEKEILQDYLILSLYLLTEPRRNIYANTKFITYDTFNKLDEENKINNNYLIYKNKNDMKFSFGDYKNVKRIGRVLLSIPDKLKKVIDLWYRFNKDKDNEWLLYNKNGNKLSTNNLSKKLKYLFRKTGKSISSTMLRKIAVSNNKYVKDYYNSKKEVLEMARKMGHSLKTQKKYYYKK